MTLKVNRRRRILFFAEAITLAHVSRPMVLAQALDPDLYEVHFACDPRFNHLFGDLSFASRPIRSISDELFLERVAHSRPFWNVADLRGYVKEDLAVIREIDPDVVVGDHRLSLAVSARLTQKPYLAIQSAHWSPYARQRFPMPYHPAVKMVGPTIGQFCFEMIRPLAFAYHSLPLNRVRREYGLPLVGFDWLRPYSDADYLMYADVPELTPTFDLPSNHFYLGPIIWSPAVTLPAWWHRLPADRPVIYVTLGSSGHVEYFGVVLNALAELRVWVLAATAGRIDLAQVPENVFIAKFLPGLEAAKRADLVICNGGSPTTHQALASATPVLAIASSMDQLMNMQAICLAGAGEVLRAGEADASLIQTCVTKLLSQPRYTAAAQAIAEIFAKYDAPCRFREILAQVVGV
jgi:UDP:flavonoid glycosyltransferase YjiC (YdhE family)